MFAGGSSLARTALAVSRHGVLTHDVTGLSVVYNSARHVATAHARIVVVVGGASHHTDGAGAAALLETPLELALTRLQPLEPCLQELCATHVCTRVDIGGRIVCPRNVLNDRMIAFPSHAPVATQVVVGDLAAACEALCHLGWRHLEGGEASDSMEGDTTSLAAAIAVTRVHNPRELLLTLLPEWRWYEVHKDGSIRILE